MNGMTTKDVAERWRINMGKFGFYVLKVSNIRNTSLWTCLGYSY